LAISAKHQWGDEVYPLISLSLSFTYALYSFIYETPPKVPPYFECCL
jgi:hypothetical protein